MESVKPRWHAILNIKSKETAELFFSLEKQIRNKLRKAVKFGVDIYKDNTHDIETMYKFIEKKGNYSLKYYQELLKNFGENAELFFAKLNTEIYVKNSTILYEKEQDKNNYLNNYIQDEGSKGKDMRVILNKKMESDRILASYKKHLVNSTNLLGEYPDGLVIGGAIVIKHGNTINLLIDGISEKHKNLCANYLLKWKIVEKYANSNIEIFDLNAISGNFSTENKYRGLNESKLGYNSLATEYIGEFNLVINKPIYSLYRNTKDKFNIKEQEK